MPGLPVRPLGTGSPPPRLWTPATSSTRCLTPKLIQARTLTVIASLEGTTYTGSVALHNISSTYRGMAEVTADLASVHDYVEPAHKALGQRSQATGQHSLIVQ